MSDRQTLADSKYRPRA